MLAVLELGAELARSWRIPASGERLAELRHRGPHDASAAKPAACRPLPPALAPGPGDAWARRCAAALGYTVAERELPPPKDRAAGFTAREHAVIFVNPLRPGGAEYPNAASLRAELALTLIHELVHTVDPDEHEFAHSGPVDGRPDPAVQALEAAAGRRSELVAVLATEALAYMIADQGGTCEAAGGCGGSQLRYLAALLRAEAPPTGDELEAILTRACAALDVLTDAARQAPWIEPRAEYGHFLRLGTQEVPLACGPAAHGGPPPHAAAQVAARWSRQRVAALAERTAAAKGAGR